MKDIRPRNPLLWIKYRYLEWQWDRVLRHCGWSTWEAYFRWNDPDWNPAGRTVREQLHGYPYVAHVPIKHLETRMMPMWGDVYSAGHIDEWCQQNCRSLYRWHWERVRMDHEGQYLPDGFAGTDEMFFGFKDERDYIMFTLRWS